MKGLRRWSHCGNNRAVYEFFESSGWFKCTIASMQLGHIHHSSSHHHSTSSTARYPSISKRPHSTSSTARTRTSQGNYGESAQARPPHQELHLVSKRQVTPQRPQLTSLSSPNIRRRRLNQRIPLQHLPHNVQQKEHPHTRIRCEEVRQLITPPPTLRLRKRLKPIEQDHQHEEEERRPRRVRLERRPENKRVAVHALGLHRAVEPNVREADARPREALRDGGEVLEPGEDEVGAGAQAHEGEEGDGGRDGDAVVGDAGL